MPDAYLHPEVAILQIMAISPGVVEHSTQLLFVVAESSLDVESVVRRTIGANMKEQLLNIPSWRGFNNPWMAEDDQDVDFSYINLVDNPERFTGYKVASLLTFAHVQQCFQAFH